MIDLVEGLYDGEKITINGVEIEGWNQNDFTPDTCGACGKHLKVGTNITLLMTNLYIEVDELIT